MVVKGVLKGDGACWGRENPSIPGWEGHEEGAIRPDDVREISSIEAS
jgi:hypothetical protein